MVFYRERKEHERLDLITKALPIFATIDSFEKEGKIGAEQAEIFRKSIYSGATNFILAGAILPEFESHSSYNPKQLMAPEPKLLGMGPDVVVNKANEDDEINDDNAANSDDDNDEQEDELTPEEKKLLRSIAAKRRKKAE